MGRNIEIKARMVALEEQTALALTLADAPPVVLQQLDTFFQVQSGRLKLREFGDGTGELIRYHRPDQTDAACSNYTLYRTSDPTTLKSMLTQSLGTAGVVDKTRTLLLCGQTRIHLDQVKGLGAYLELEVVLTPDQSEAEGTAIATDLTEKLGIEDHHLLAHAYVDLLERQKG